ncbi:15049_t:CDS:2 [Funneliformis geosporum]|uniref:15049_t:CDS:1 n=1 Tax=Funneliformis geosporum TaxID=1117311 RepID=A0A9W4SNT7_9GLOM|nr:15049_t:CDS:2 [Funneliformis geosporum]
MDKWKMQRLSSSKGGPNVEVENFSQAIGRKLDKNIWFNDELAT